MSEKIRIAIAGASGRMGKMLIETVTKSDDCRLVGALDVKGSPAIGGDACAFLGKNSGVFVTSDLESGLKNAQVLIDFTRPEGTLLHLAICQRLGTKMVIGTTGLSAADKALIAQAAQRIAIVLAPNMGVGVNVMLKLLSRAAQTLTQGYDVEVIEAHHRHKIDAPSGTALKMGEVLAQAMGRDLEKDGVFVRHGITGERAPSSIGFSTIRGGDIVGDHTVMFVGTGERIEISHKASSRQPYADGSLRAARYLEGQTAGLFDMFDVLQLR